MYWDAGCALIRTLRLIRFQTVGTQPNPRRADRAIRRYCLRLRRSEPEALLAGIMREYRVPDHGVVILLYAVGCFFGVPDMFSDFDIALLLAVGFNPPALLRLRRMLLDRVGFCRLLDLRGRTLLPSRELITLLHGPPLGDYEARTTKRALERYPTASRDSKAKQPEEEKNP
jgi:hypothetical protein